MAKISDRKLKEVKERILHGGSYLELEAFELQVPKEELRYALQHVCNGGVKSGEYKAMIRNSEATSSRIPEEELAKLCILPKPSKRRATSSTQEERLPAEQVINLMPPVEDESDLDPMEMLLREKEDLEKEYEATSNGLEKAKKILELREETAKKAESALQSAQALAKNAKEDVKRARHSVQNAECSVNECNVAIQRVMEEIEQLKLNTVYLVDPWYTGEMPTYGTLLSTVELNGVTVQQAEEEYFPEATLQGVLMFDQVSDYKKSLEFCALVIQHIIEGKCYRLCVSDERIKSMLKMYID